MTSLPEQLQAILADQPHAVIERGDIRYVLLGTAHVSQASVDTVKKAIDSQVFDTIAVELDNGRHQALIDPNIMAKMDLLKVIREGRAGMMIANLALAAYQRRLADQLGIEPGAELKLAAQLAGEKKLKLELIDRDIGITFKRAWKSLGWWRRSMLGAGILGGLFVDEKVDEEHIEQLKQGDLLESNFTEMAGQSPELYQAIIAERDLYMAAKLQKIDAKDSEWVLAVIGAGHLAGIKQHLENSISDPHDEIAALDSVPQSSNIPWFTLALITFLLGGFAWGFAEGGMKLGSTLIAQWVLITGAGGALGCLAAGGHPLSILAAFVASPITPLHPALGSGMVSALVEAQLRKPNYDDFLSLRDDVSKLSGWWKNRVSRTLLNMFLTSLGTAIAVWLAGANLIGQLR